ncbi:MAG TPA: hypothetical protein VH500_11490 [Nitrososphaeraceae archaeon]|jgi:hypothetical protein
MSIVSLGLVEKLYDIEIPKYAMIEPDNAVSKQYALYHICQNVFYYATTLTARYY